MLTKILSRRIKGVWQRITADELLADGILTDLVMPKRGSYAKGIVCAFGKRKRKNAKLLRDKATKHTHQQHEGLQQFRYFNLEQFFSFLTLFYELPLVV